MAQLDSTIFTREQQRMMLEQAMFACAHVASLGPNSLPPKAMKAAQAQINVDQVQDVMDDIQEQVPSPLRALPSPREPAGEVRSADRGG